MSYNLALTNGTTLIPGGLADGTTDNTYTSLTLIGKNFPGYGTFLNENLIHLLENFSNSTAPAQPLVGQLWWNSTAKLLTVWSGSTWKAVSSSTSAASAPSGPIAGDLWWDTVNSQLKVYSGSAWVTIGPAFTPSQGTSGAVVDTIVDNSSVSHTVVKFYISNTLVAILNKDTEFTPATSISGFATVKTGMSLSSAITGLEYYGDADNALNLGGVEAANYLRSDTNDTTYGSLTIANNSGWTVGNASSISLTTTSSTATFTNATLNSSIKMYVNAGGVSKQALYVKGTDGLIEVLGDPTTNLGVATKQYVDNTIAGATGGVYIKRDGTTTITGNITPQANANVNFGGSTLRFNTIYSVTFNGTAVQANYADLAERFASDAEYATGTVVEIGGEKEITQVSSELSDKVFGVISTKAAYLMNAEAGTDATHPAVALQGRVPVRVVGKVAKGDRLVSAGNGLGRAGRHGEITPWNVFGRALEDKLDTEEGIVEAVVKVNS